jgi:ABC-2 type transport system permease protein
LDLVSAFLIGLIELAEVWVLFHNVTHLGGFTFREVLLVFGLADLSFSAAELAVGHCDTIPRYVRAGTLDVFYLRPQPLLRQLITSDVSLKRMSRAGIGLAAMAFGLVLNDIDWGLRSIALLLIAIVSATVTFAAMFVIAAGLQFFVINGAEMTNAFVYGGRYAATQPSAVWSKPIKVAFGYVFPMAFTAYLPVVAILGRSGPPWLPSWLGWCAPVAAVWAWSAALLCWRAGVRRYQGAGG